MKKIMAICIGFIIFLSGCSKATTENDELITDGTVTDVPEIYSEMITQRMFHMSTLIQK